MSKIRNVVQLTEAQYEELRTNGTLTVGDLTILFDPETLYITPEAAGGGIDLSNYVTQENFDKLINNETQLQSTSDRNLLIGHSILYSSSATNGTGVGYGSTVNKGGVAVGGGSVARGEFSTAIGFSAVAEKKGSIAIGSNGGSGLSLNAEAEAEYSIQIGKGKNENPNTLQIWGDNIYNHSTHTLTVQNIALNGVDLQGTLTALEGQNEYIGRYEGNSYTAETIQTELSSFVSTTAGRDARNGDLVNIVNGIYAGQQWRFGGTLWIYYINFENHNVINNLNSTSTTDGLSAAQGKVLSDEILRLDGEVSGNTEDIAMLQGDMAGKTNVTFNNVHQDYVNFSSDPQTQINELKSQLKTLYSHNIKIYGTIEGHSIVSISCCVISGDQTLFTKNTFQAFLYNNGFTSASKLLSASGCIQRLKVANNDVYTCIVSGLYSGWATSNPSRDVEWSGVSVDTANPTNSRLSDTLTNTFNSSINFVDTVLQI